MFASISYFRPLVYLFIGIIVESYGKFLLYI